jgi:hypothetical protein
VEIKENRKPTLFPRGKQTLLGKSEEKQHVHIGSHKLYSGGLLQFYWLAGQD